MKEEEKKEKGRRAEEKEERKEKRSGQKFRLHNEKTLLSSRGIQAALIGPEEEKDRRADWRVTIPVSVDVDLFFSSTLLSALALVFCLTITLPPSQFSTFLHSFCSSLSGDYHGLDILSLFGQSDP